MIRLLKRIGEIDEVFSAPPSKSYTHRALIAGALGSGTTTIVSPLHSDDTDLTLQALSRLGVAVTADPNGIRIEGCDGSLPNGKMTNLDLGNSGTSLRLLASLALLCQHPVILTGSQRMQERPIGPLAEALAALGGTVAFLHHDGYPPLRIGGHLRGGAVTVDGNVSSQFISSVLLAAPYAENGICLTVPSPPSSRSYLDITLDLMEEFGAEVIRDSYRWFEVSPGARYHGRTYRIEGDYSSASYLFAIAAICGGRVTVTNLRHDTVQGDREFVTALRSMGCTVSTGPDAVTVERTGPLHGITIDMSSSPDSVQTLCMVAAMAGSPTTISGIGHLKYKESDRITNTAALLRSLGGDVRPGDGSITITPARLHGGVIDPGNDHRTAMSFAVLGLGIGGVRIADAECVSKSYPEFWEIIGKVMD